MDNVRAMNRLERAEDLIDEVLAYSDQMRVPWRQNILPYALGNDHQSTAVS